MTQGCVSTFQYGACRSHWIHSCLQKRPLGWIVGDFILPFPSFDLLNFLQFITALAKYQFLTSISMSASLHLHMHTSCLSHFTAISTEHSLGPLTLPCPILPHPSLPSVSLPVWILRSQATEHHWQSWKQRDKSIRQSDKVHELKIELIKASV